MRAKSGHIVFEEGFEYQDLAPIVEEMFELFLEESKQPIDDEEYKEMLIHLNKEYLERNQKPEGYNRPSRIRIIFPIRDDDRVEFYLVGPANAMETVRVTELISSFLSTKNLDHEVYWDDIPKKEDML